MAETPNECLAGFAPCHRLNQFVLEGELVGAESLWTAHDIAEYTRKSLSWVHKRIAPNTPHYPKIPRVANIGHPRFDPEVVKALFPSGTSRSLKIKEIGNSVLLDTKQKRQKEKLW